MSVSTLTRTESSILPLLPGLALALAIAVASLSIHHFAGIAALSPLMLAMVIGIGLRNLVPALPGSAPGMQFAVKRLLRLAIVLLGLQVTLGQIAGLGMGGLLAVVVTLLSTFLFTRRIGARMGVPAKLAELIAAGSSICGASAVIATNTVTEGSEEDVAFAVANVTIYGTLSMLLFPVIGGLLHMAPESYGLWAGASIHEVAQVVGAAFQRGDVAGHVGTVAKLARVLILAPLILTLGALRSRGGQQDKARAPMPWFVLGFAAMVVLGSVTDLPAPVLGGASTLTTFLLTIALAAMGYGTDIRRLRAVGHRPLLLGGIAWIFISVVGLISALLLAGL